MMRDALRSLLVLAVAVSITSSAAAQHAPADADGTTALHWAVHKGDRGSAERLIRGGADVNAANRYGVTPSSLAATNGDAAMLELLLGAGADPNAASPEGETILMTASRTGVPQAVKTLIARGANVNAAERWKGQTALMWAAAEGHAAAIRVLLDAGADVQARSTAGFTALLFAAREGRLEAVRTLLEGGADVNDMILRKSPPAPGGTSAAPVPGPTALVLAAGSAHFELAAALLDAGADPNSAAHGWTALHHVTWIRKPGQGSNNPAPYGSGSMDSLTFVRKLKAHGADLNARVTRKPNVGFTTLNLVGGTAFFLAARGADVELMRLLVELGANPLLPNEDGTTPLMSAAGIGTTIPGEDPGEPSECLEAVKLALALGNDVNVVDKNGNTAMHGAAFKQLPDVVTLLAASGARVDIWNRNNGSGWTPLRIAVGVHRDMNFRFHVPTADALREVMTRAGVSTDVEPEPVISSATKTK